MITLTFRTAAITNAGGRFYNEDACGYRNGCWVVADGLGGHGGGEVASKLAVDTILHQVSSTAKIDAAALLRAITVADQVIHQTQSTDSRLSRMRTTMVMLYSDGHCALWAHIGDSRLYHFRNGRINFQTSDHSMPQVMADAGDISYAEIRFHEDRNRLLRCLGSDKVQHPTLAKTALELHPGDVFLLCTDGFWEYVTESAMEVALAKFATPEQWLQAMQAILLKYADPEHDNYTALAVFVYS